MSLYFLWKNGLNLSIPPNHLLLDTASNLGPLISRWEINRFENFRYKSVRILEVPKLLFQQFLNLSGFQRDMCGPILGDLSNNRWYYRPIKLISHGSEFAVHSAGDCRAKDWITRLLGNRIAALDEQGCATCGVVNHTMLHACARERWTCRRVCCRILEPKPLLLRRQCNALERSCVRNFESNGRERRVVRWLRSVRGALLSCYETKESVICRCMDYEYED